MDTGYEIVNTNGQDEIVPTSGASFTLPFSPSRRMVKDVIAKVSNREFLSEEDCEIIVYVLSDWANKEYGYEQLP